MTTFILYSNGDPFEKYGENLINQAKQYFDNVHHYKSEDIQSFKKENINLWKYNKGDGCWSWKPYIIKQELLKEKNKDNIVVYCDTRFHMNGNIAKLIKEYFYNSENYIFALKNHHFSKGSRHQEIMWSKGDAFKAVGVNMNDMPFQEQVWAGFICFKNNEKSIKIIDEWLSLCKDEQIISDLDSIHPNHFLFKGHRHDQTILSLILKKNDIQIEDNELSETLSNGHYMQYFYP